MCLPVPPQLETVGTRVERGRRNTQCFGRALSQWTQRFWGSGVLHTPRSGLSRLAAPPCFEKENERFASLAPEDGPRVLQGRPESSDSSVRGSSSSEVRTLMEEMIKALRLSPTCFAVPNCAGPGQVVSTWPCCHRRMADHPFCVSSSKSQATFSDSILERATLEEGSRV
jgi:hypothetical protein